MAADQKLFRLTSEHTVAEWIKIISVLTHATASQRPVEKLDVAVLDSFEWSLWNANAYLFAEQSERVNLRWVQTQKKQKKPADMQVEKLPIWPNDIPEGRMRDRLAKLLDLRCLLKQATYQADRSSMAVVDDSNVVRVRLSFDQISQRVSPRRKPVEMGCFLRVEGLAGYEADFAETIERLDSLGGIDAFDEAQLVTSLLENLNRVPNDYSGKIKIKLDRTMRSDEALKAILLDQLETIERNIDGTKQDLDSEFLHDLRVAVRRSRSALNRLKGVLPLTVQEKFAHELAWVGSITTPVRDLDVYMIDYPKYRDQLRDDLRGDLEPLYDFMCAHHKKERATLVTQLNSRRFKEFLSKWRAFLKRALPARPSADAALIEIGIAADKRIWKTYRRVIAEGSAIHEDTEAEALHDLRKTCKKLRYLLEFFSSLYPAEEVSKLVKTLKILQENLGDFQDLDVQADKLHEFSTTMLAEGQKDPKTFMAMGILVEGFMERKAVVRTEFAERFTAFASKEVEMEFRKLTNKQKKKQVKIAIPAA